MYFRPNNLSVVDTLYVFVCCFLSVTCKYVTNYVYTYIYIDTYLFLVRKMVIISHQSVVAVLLGRKFWLWVPVATPWSSSSWTICKISGSQRGSNGHIWGFFQWIGGKNYRRHLYLMEKTMVSCRLSLQTIQ